MQSFSKPELLHNPIQTSPEKNRMVEAIRLKYRTIEWSKDKERNEPKRRFTEHHESKDLYHSISPKIELESKSRRSNYNEKIENTLVKEKARISLCSNLPKENYSSPMSFKKNTSPKKYNYLSVPEDK